MNDSFGFIVPSELTPAMVYYVCMSYPQSYYNAQTGLPTAIDPGTGLPLANDTFGVSSIGADSLGNPTFGAPTGTGIICLQQHVVTHLAAVTWNGGGAAIKAQAAAALAALQATVNAAAGTVSPTFTPGS
jgi:hypothetical protein